MAEKHTSEKYRKKPVVIEAHQWNPRERPTALPDWLWDAIGMTPELFNENDGSIGIRTLEGTMIANPGDWIIRGVQGELYPCKPDIFAATYEPAGIPTAALEGRTAGEGLRAIKAKFDAMKATAYKLPNKCECSGSEACVCCNLLADIGDLDEALSRIDAALAAGEGR